MPSHSIAPAAPPITTRVSSNGTAVASAAVSVQVSDPLGGITTISGKTDNHGTAKVKYVVKAPTSKAGIYAVTSTATNGSSSTATTSFVVN